VTSAPFDVDSFLGRPLTARIATGSVLQVIARGRAEILTFDVARGRRLLVRYLGTDESRWDPRLASYLTDDPEERGTVWLRIAPKALTARDLSYSAAL
jgi:hypothetical protein